MKSRSLLLLGTLVPLLAGCLSETTMPREQCQAAVIPQVTGDTVRTASGLKYIVIAQGDTSSIVPTGADSVGVNYAGYLPAGRLFANTGGSGPQQFPLNGVIAGFSEGIQGMHVGGFRRLIIPPALGYGNNPPQESCIPGNSTLIFDVELLYVIPVGKPTT